MNRLPMHSSYVAITTGYLPSGVAFGALAASLHVPYYFIAALSLFVYSGAVQSAFLGYWTIGIDPFSMVITAFLLNLRHTFYGPHIQYQRPSLRLSQILTLSPFLTDETYAVSVTNPGLGKRGMQLIYIYAYLTWAGGTVVGIVLLKNVSPEVIDALALALSALFLGLLVPKIDHADGLIVALVSGIIAVAGRLLGLSDIFIIVPILSGLFVGVLLLRKGGKQHG